VDIDPLSVRAEQIILGRDREYPWLDHIEIPPAREFPPTVFMSGDDPDYAEASAREELGIEDIVNPNAPTTKPGYTSSALPKALGDKVVEMLFEAQGQDAQGISWKNDIVASTTTVMVAEELLGKIREKIAASKNI
jgi:hypothetical protein